MVEVYLTQHLRIDAPPIKGILREEVQQVINKVLFHRYPLLANYFPKKMKDELVEFVFVFLCARVQAYTSDPANVGRLRVFLTNMARYIRRECSRRGWPFILVFTFVLSALMSGLLMLLQVVFRASS